MDGERNQPLQATRLSGETVRLSKSLDESNMTKQKVGLVLFWIGVVWAFLRPIGSLSQQVLVQSGTTICVPWRPVGVYFR
jgi:hypothetical protein